MRFIVNSHSQNGFDFQSMHKHIFLLIGFVGCLAIQVHGQRFPDVTFAKLPQNYQLFPRADNNLAEVPIEGIFTNKDISAYSIRVTRNGVLYRWQKNMTTALSTFSSKFTIPAEFAEYNFEVFGFKGKDSSLVTKVSNVVAGDAFYVSGQSNAWIGPVDELVYQGEWLRSFGLVQGSDNVGPYNVADTLWSLAIGRARIGPWSAEIAKQIIDSEKIPICIINSAAGGSIIDWHLILNGNTKEPIEGGNIMYYKGLKSGTLKFVKGIIFRQGESEISAFNSLYQWGIKFEQLKKKYKQLFPNAKNLFLPQLNVYEYPFREAALEREDQRKQHTFDPYVKSFATVGTKEFDRLHYGNGGYRQNGLEQARIILNTIYKKPFPAEIYSPNIKRAYFMSNEERDKLYLEFDEGQNLILPSDTTVTDEQGKKKTSYLVDNFFWDRLSSQSMGKYIKKIEVLDGRKLILNFSIQYDGNMIGYLPDYHRGFITKESEYPYPGPFIRNKMGMRAMAFTAFPITVLNNEIIDFAVTPNPATSRITINWPDLVKGNLQIFNMRGDLISTFIIEGLNFKEIDVSKYITGNYFAIFTAKNGVVSKKRMAIFN